MLWQRRSLSVMRRERRPSSQLYWVSGATKFNWWLAIKYQLGVMAFKCIYTFWILLLKSEPWIYIANKCEEHFACGDGGRVALEHGLSCEWGLSSVHPVQRGRSCPGGMDDSLTTLPRALSDHTSRAACQVNQTKTHKNSPSAVSDHWTIFEPGKCFLVHIEGPGWEHNVRANVRTWIWNKSHVEISVWPRVNSLNILPSKLIERENLPFRQLW